ncbi:uncharacterized protein BT62DRAFT_987328 [Guyanagaster necrorhizus]|uniref:Uncharacterized protein n=1 Tax=Guyanagaster necrorhizus TaxID=856835 RepID=A0A9P7VT86_9AGAR|nr:uncharacterized protein BT62DRAFT_987328 [Guyanagaster necrorhizus MCA 3950]KAG7445664.1 hypothetical protein BT62DRAFT_987328 [Guyanagaster necrorhizus MCA 3950]
MTCDYGLNILTSRENHLVLMRQVAIHFSWAISIRALLYLSLVFFARILSSFSTVTMIL